MSYYASPPTLDHWSPAQVLLSQGKGANLLRNVRKLPQPFSDNLRPRSEEPWGNFHAHHSLHPKAASSIIEDFTCEICSDPRYSEISRDSEYILIHGFRATSPYTLGLLLIKQLRVTVATRTSFKDGLSFCATLRKGCIQYSMTCRKSRDDVEEEYMQGSSL